MATEFQHVSDTALWVASYRAEESRRPDALFRDPLAERLAGDKGREISRNVTGSMYTRWNVVMRTCIIDRFIQQAAKNGVDLIVNLGAGLDTRPYRMELPASLAWVEADFPHMMDAKEAALVGEEPRVRLERVRVDLSDPGARGRFLDEMQARGRKIMAITEGVLPYLTNEQAADLAKDLRKRDHIRYWVADYMSKEVTEYLRKGKFRKQLKNAPFEFHPGDWFGFFENLGWKAREVRYLSDESRAQNRPIPRPLLLKLLWPFIPAKKRIEMSRWTAYVVLEPKG